MAEKRVKLTNGCSVSAKYVAAVTLSEETHRVFLKNASGETLCSNRCDSPEAAAAEIQLINEQMGW